MPAVFACLVFLVPATVACLYYFALTAVGWRRVRPLPETQPVHAFAVVIPAHDEEHGLPATVRSVLSSDYPPDKLRVLVVADNCADRTAEVARRLGADCLERHDPVHRGKGYALAAGLSHAAAGGADAVAVLDADSELDPAALRGLDAALAAGAGAAQAAVAARGPAGSPQWLVSAVGAELDNAVSVGLDRLGGSAALRGNGMAFRRAALERVPWAAFGPAEDAEYGAALRRAGVRVRFAPAAVVWTSAPPSRAALLTQRKRWRAALSAGGAGPLGRWLASKPLVLLHLLLTTATVAASAAWLPAGTAGWLLGWAGALVGLTGAVYLRAIRRAGAWPGGPGAVLKAAGAAARLGWVALAGTAGRCGGWERTPRAWEAGAGQNRLGVSGQSVSR
jgi:GT2 family glycosyltransferase